MAKKNEDQAYIRAVIFHAIAQCSPVKVKRCLERGANPNWLNELGDSVLHRVAEVGNVNVARVLLEHPETNINIVNSTGETPLMYAVMSSRREILQFLLDRGADADMSNDLGETALHIAARYRNLSLVFDLVSHGATVDVTNIFDSTPLSLVVIDHPCMLVAKYLLRKGGREAGNRAFPLLLECVLGCHTPEQIGVIEILLNGGMDINVVHPKTNMNCLHMVAITGYAPLCIFLLEKGANENVVDLVGRSPRMLAKEHGNYHFERLYRGGWKTKVLVKWKDEISYI